MRTLAFAIACIAVASPARAHADIQRTLAGSLQLDYLAVPTAHTPSAYTFDGATVELSLKMSIDFTKNASATVKACFACHGFEAAAAFVDLRAADELTVRIGRMTPELGSFPQRHDPANHHTSDKPLMYDMGRMLHKDANEWNEGVLPAPWVDNGVEVLGTHFFDAARIDYAAYALSGPKADANPVDFNFIESHTPSLYYVDNNSEPIVGARLAGAIDLSDDGDSITIGSSAMAGHYDPAGDLGFLIFGADVVLQLGDGFLRAEYLQRRMQMTTDPSVTFQYPALDHSFVKQGYYIEGEIPVSRFDLIARFDGLDRRGNVVTGSPLSDHSSVQRFTAALAYRISSNIRLKSSVEYYLFSDFDNEVAVHLGVATPF